MSRLRWPRGNAAWYASPWRHRLLLGCAFVVACAGLGRLALDAGLSWDEPFQIQYGDYVLAWFRSHFVDDHALRYKNLHLYGGLFDLAAQWLVSKLVPPWDTLAVRHVLTAVVAVLGAGASYAMAARLAGQRAGMIAGALLLLTPTWLGHGLFNPKDVPFASAAAFASYAALCIATGPCPLTWRQGSFAALCVGVALAIRPGGVFLISYPLLAAYGRWLLDARGAWRTRGLAATLRSAATITLRLSWTCAVAWLLMISTWPWAQQAPFTRPLEGISKAAHFAWRGAVLFRGQHIPATQLPNDYLPVWFGITLPETYLFAFVCGCVEIGVWLLGRNVGTHPRRLGLCLLAWFVVFPVLAALAVRPAIYDAHRHFLFMLPPLAALAGVALARFFRDRGLPKQLRHATAVALLAVGALVIYDMLSLHPYEYVYFNRLSGGLPGAFGRFETDYWGASHREGLAWLLDHYPKRPDAGRIRLAGCNRPPHVAYYLRHWPELAAKFKLAGSDQRAQIYLAVTRYDCHKAAGKIIHIVERQGVPLLYVFER